MHSAYPVIFQRAKIFSFLLGFLEQTISFFSKMDIALPYGGSPLGCGFIQQAVIEFPSSKTEVTNVYCFISTTFITSIKFGILVYVFFACKESKPISEALFFVTLIGQSESSKCNTICPFRIAPHLSIFWIPLCRSVHRMSSLVETLANTLKIVVAL